MVVTNQMGHCRTGAARVPSCTWPQSPGREHRKSALGGRRHHRAGYLTPCVSRTFVASEPTHNRWTLLADGRCGLVRPALCTNERHTVCDAWDPRCDAIDNVLCHRSVRCPFATGDCYQSGYGVDVDDVIPGHALRPTDNPGCRFGKRPNPRPGRRDVVPPNGSAEDLRHFIQYPVDLCMAVRLPSIVR